MYRIEISIPLYYNNNSLIEVSKIDATRKEIIKKFGALTAMPANANTALDGWWVNQGQTYKDKIIIFRIDCSEFNQRFWAKYKSLLKRRFQQEEIYITKSEIQTI